MGDRGNIEIVQGTRWAGEGQETRALDSVFLYTHWRGSQVAQILASALEKSGIRGGDPSYLTRIIFNELQGDDRTTTGFGISVGHPDDNEYSIPKVIWHRNNEGQKELRILYNGRDYSPEEFVAEYANKEQSEGVLV